MNRTIKTFEQSIAEAEQEALCKDAERYRWLRSNHLQTGSNSWIRTGDDLDEAVDAGMAEHELKTNKER